MKKFYLEMLQLFDKAIFFEVQEKNYGILQSGTGGVDSSGTRRG